MRGLKNEVRKCAFCDSPAVGRFEMRTKDIKLWLCEKHRPPPVKHMSRFWLSFPVLSLATIIYFVLYQMAESNYYEFGDLRRLNLVGKMYATLEPFLTTPLGQLFIGVGIVLLALWGITFIMWIRSHSKSSP